MPYTKEQLKAYWQANKEHFNQKRRQKRRLAKLTTGWVSHSKVSQKMANPTQVSHGQLLPEMANPKLIQLLKEWQTSTNYHCAGGCSQDKYCSNCWYFTGNQLIDYKEVKV